MIFGIDVRYRIIRSLELVCPRCGLDRTGAEVVPVRWVCLFGAPVLPLGEHELEVVCDECGHASDIGVLDVPTSAQLSALLREATIGALVRAVRSADPVDADIARTAAIDTLDDTGFDADPADFDSALITLADTEVGHRLRRVGDELTAYGKQGFLHRVAAVATAGGPISAVQRDVLVQIGCDLGMAAPHINGILAVANTSV